MDDESGATGAATDDLVARLRARLAQYDQAPPRRIRGLRWPDLSWPSWPSWPWWPERAGVTRLGQRLRRRWVAVGLGGLVAGAIALGVGLSGRSSGDPLPPRAAPPSASDHASLTVRSTPTSVVPTTIAALTRIPAAWQSSCRSAPALDARAQSALVCAPAAGTALEVRAMAPAASGAALARLVPATVPERGDAACAHGVAERRAWSTPQHPQVIAGRFACFRSARGAELVWSVDRDDTVLRAVRADGDLSALFRWWEQAPI